MTKTLAIVTNVPTPYRNHFFGQLAQELDRERGSLVVLFAAETEPNRTWNASVEGDNYRSRVLAGRSIALRKTFVHLNVGVASQLKEIDPRWILIAGSWHGPTTLRALRWGRRRARPCIFWSEGHDAAVLHPSGPISLVRQRIYRRFDGFAVPNDRSEAFARRMAGRPATMLRLPNTVDDRFWSSSRESQDDARATLGLDARRVVSVAAQLEPRKRVVECLEAFSSLPESTRTKVQLVVAGSGSLEAAVRAAADGSGGAITFLGDLNQSEVRTLYRATDLLLLASSYDPNPLCMIEAAFAGCGLIATSEVGNADELLGSESPFLIRVPVGGGIVDPVARALAQVAILNDSRLEEHKRATRRRVDAGFTSSEVANSFINQLQANFPPECGET